MALHVIECGQRGEDAPASLNSSFTRQCGMNMERVAKFAQGGTKALTKTGEMRGRERACLSFWGGSAQGQSSLKI